MGTAGSHGRVDLNPQSDLAADLGSLYRLRFPERDRLRKAQVWEVIVGEFFQRWVGARDTVLDLGCGYGEFLNNVRCGRRIGVDLNPDSPAALAPEVEFHLGTVDDLTFQPDHSVDVVFSSNVLEHLPNKRVVEATLLEVRRVLRPGGSVILMGPNLRFLPGEYWDFWDHLVPITDRSIHEVVSTLGFHVTHLYPRFLPYTTRSSLPKFPALVRWYLRMPIAWRVLGGQFLMRATTPAGPAFSDDLISVVLPVHNEAATIEACIRGISTALRGLRYEILVCYDLEQDDTLPVIAAMEDSPASLRMVRNTVRPGVAFALRTGFEAARGDVIVTTMADLSDPPEVIPDLAAKVRNEGAAVVSGSRYMKGGAQVGGPWLKSTLSRLAGLSLHYLTGVSTRDPTTNFRAYSAEFLRATQVESQRGFEVALELTAKAHLFGLKIAEVPSTWTERSVGKSKFQLWKWLPSYLRWYARMAAEPTLVWLVWLAAVAWAVSYVAAYGTSLPFADEWSNIPYLEGQQPVTLEWLWSWHNDHRIPLARVAYLVGARLAGTDVRGSMFASVLILSLCAGLCIIVARRIRGRSRITDALMPLTIVGPVNYGSLLDGFQIAFVLTTGLFCVIVCVLVGARQRLTAPALVTLGVCLIGLPMTGSAGLILAVPITAFVGYIAVEGVWQARSRSSRDAARSDGAGARAKTTSVLSRPLAAGVVSVVGLAGIVLYDPLHAPHPAGIAATNFEDGIRGALEFLAAALSADYLDGHWWVLSGIAGLFALFAGLDVAQRVLVGRSNRTSGLGILTCFSALAALAIGVGFGRAYGLAPRYAMLAVPVLVLAYLSVIAARGVFVTVVRWGLFIAIVALLPLNYSNASQFGQNKRDVYLGVSSDIASGMSVNLVATRHYKEIFPGDTDATVALLENIQAYSLGPFAGHALTLNESPPTVVSQEELQVDPLEVHDMVEFGDAWRGTTKQPWLTFSLGTRSLAGVRLFYSQTNSSGEPAIFRVLWTDTSPDAFGPKEGSNTVYDDALEPAKHDRTIWIGEKAPLLRIAPDTKPTTFRLEKIVLLLSETTPEEELIADAITHLPDGLLVRSNDQPGIYLIQRGRKRVFPSWQSYLARGGTDDMTNVSVLADGELGAIPDGPLMPDA